VTAQIPTPARCSSLASISSLPSPCRVRTFQLPSRRRLAGNSAIWRLVFRTAAAFCPRALVPLAWPLALASAGSGKAGCGVAGASCGSPCLTWYLWPGCSLVRWFLTALAVVPTQCGHTGHGVRCPVATVTTSFFGPWGRFRVAPPCCSSPLPPSAPRLLDSSPPRLLGVARGAPSCGGGSALALFTSVWPLSAWCRVRWFLMALAEVTACLQCGHGVGVPVITVTVDCALPLAGFVFPLLFGSVAELRDPRATGSRAPGTFPASSLFVSSHTHTHHHHSSRLRPKSRTLLATAKRWLHRLTSRKRLVGVPTNGHGARVYTGRSPKPWIGQGGYRSEPLGGTRKRVLLIAMAGQGAGLTRHRRLESGSALMWDLLHTPESGGVLTLRAAQVVSFGVAALLPLGDWEALARHTHTHTLKP